MTFGVTLFSTVLSADVNLALYMEMKGLVESMLDKASQS